MARAAKIATVIPIDVKIEFALAAALAVQRFEATGPFAKAVNAVAAWNATLRYATAEFAQLIAQQLEKWETEVRAERIITATQIDAKIFTASLTTAERLKRQWKRFCKEDRVREVINAYQETVQMAHAPVIA